MARPECPASHPHSASMLTKSLSSPPLSPPRPLTAAPSPPRSSATQIMCAERALHPGSVLVSACFSFRRLLEGSRVGGWSCGSHLPIPVSFTDTQPLSAPHSHPQGFYLLLPLVLVCHRWKHLTQWKRKHFCPTGARGSEQQLRRDCSFPLLCTQLRGAVGSGLLTRPSKQPLSRQSHGAWHTIVTGFPCAGRQGGQGGRSPDSRPCVKLARSPWRRSCKTPVLSPAFCPQTSSVRRLVSV